METNSEKSPAVYQQDVCKCDLNPHIIDLISISSISKPNLCTEQCQANDQTKWSDSAPTLSPLKDSCNGLKAIWRSCIIIQ